MGFGGSCFQKDILNLVYLCKYYGLDEVAEFWHQVVKINDYQKKRFAQKIIDHFGGDLIGKKVAVLGWAFKANTNDTRESASIKVSEILYTNGADLIIYDPFVRDKKIMNDIINYWEESLNKGKIRIVNSKEEAIALSDVGAILTEWEEFNSLNPMKLIFDGRNILKGNKVNNLGKMINKIALITGITGQDGSYLAEFLIEKGYEVHGIIRRCSSFNTERIEHLYIEELIDDLHNKMKLKLHYGDLTDSTSLIRLVNSIKPDEIYNLAAQSHVRVSFDLPEYTAETDGLGTLRLLEAVRICQLEKKCKIYQASTSELYGKVMEVPQNENTPFYPRSPYGVSKLYAYWITKNYREAYDIFAVNGILFNHESERRGETFVTRKISLAAARISIKKQKKLYLGNIDAKRDWGYAKDFVKCMWLMLQQDHPEDFVIATGVQHSVREFVELAFKEVSINIKWVGKGINEKGVDAETGNVIIEIDPKYYRPTEVDTLLGNPQKAKTKLKWNPSETSFEALVKIMVKSDLKLAKIENSIRKSYD